MSASFPVVVSAVIIRDDTILLLKRSENSDHAPGDWDTCSGRLERGETLEEAVVREAREETGLHVSPVRVIDVFRFLRGNELEECIGITFLCADGGGEVQLSDEHSEARWVKLTDARDYALPPGLLHVLEGL